METITLIVSDNRQEVVSAIERAFLRYAACFTFADERMTPTNLYGHWILVEDVFFRARLDGRNVEVEGSLLSCLHLGSRVIRIALSIKGMSGTHPICREWFPDAVLVYDIHGELVLEVDRVRDSDDEHLRPVGAFRQFGCPVEAVAG